MVYLEKSNEGRVSGRCLGQNRGNPVKTLELFTALLIGERCVALNASTLFADQKGNHLKLGAVRGAYFFSGDGLSLDLANLASEDGDEPRVIEGSAA